jgi:hypothetical protein
MTDEDEIIHATFWSRREEPEEQLLWGQHESSKEEVGVTFRVSFGSALIGIKPAQLSPTSQSTSGIVFPLTRYSALHISYHMSLCDLGHSRAAFGFAKVKRLDFGGGLGGLTGTACASAAARAWVRVLTLSSAACCFADIACLDIKRASVTVERVASARTSPANRISASDETIIIGVQPGQPTESSRGVDGEVVVVVSPTNGAI